jgi:hypothetical protein
MDVLAEDQDRVKAVESDARKKIYAGVAKYNGDLKRYVNVGGISDLSDYRNAVLQSKEVKNAINNKMNLGLYLDAASKGMYVKPITMEAMEKDPITGEEKTVNKQVDFEEQYKMFKEGKIDQLQFTGAEKMGDISPMDFKATMKDHTNPYSKDNIVTGSQIYEAATLKGISHEQSTMMAKNYMAVINNGGQPWRWGSKDMADYNLNAYNAETGRMNANTSRMTAEAKWAAAQQEEKNKNLSNAFVTDIYSMGRDSDGNEIAETKNIDVKSVQKGIPQLLGGLTKGPTEADGSVGAGEKWLLDKSRSYELTDGTKLNGADLNNMYVMGADKIFARGDRKFIMYTMMTNDDDLVIPGITHGTIDQDLTENATASGWSFIDPSGSYNAYYTGTILVDITDQIKDPVNIEAINNLLGFKGGRDYTAPSLSDADQQRMVQNNMNNSTMNTDNTINAGIQSNQNR